MDFQQIPVTIGLIIANVLFSLAGFNNNKWTSKFIMWPYGVKRQKEYYRFISSGFLHADFIHLFFNMFTLYSFGGAIEIYFKVFELGGTAAYLGLYVLGLIISDIPTYIKQQDNSRYYSLGASGAVSAILFGAIIFDPWSSVELYAAIRIPGLLFAVLYVIYCVYMSKNGQDNVNHDAHLWGSLVGLVLVPLLIVLMNPPLFEYIQGKFMHPHFFGQP